MKKLILDFLKQNKFRASLIVLSGITWAILFPGIPYFLGKIIDIIKNATDYENIFNLIAYPISFLIATNLLYNINQYILFSSIAACVPKWKFNIINERHLNIIRAGQGKHVNKIMNTINGFENVIRSLSVFIFPQALMLLISIYMIFSINSMFAIIILLWIIIITRCTHVISKKLSYLSHSFNETGSLLSNEIMENIEGKESLSSSIRMCSEDFLYKDEKLQFYIARNKFSQGMLNFLFISFALIGLIYLYSKQMITIGELTFIFSILFKVAGLINDFNSNIIDLKKNIGQLKEGVGLYGNLDAFPT